MIKKLSSRFVLGLVASCSSLVSYGQFPANITTTYLTNPVTNLVTYTATVTPPQYGTFSVTNNNTFPVKITEVGNLHAGNVGTGNQNGGTYILWEAPEIGATSPDQNLLATTPAIGISLKWVQCGQSSKTITSTTNSIIPVITVVNGAFIAPGQTRRFALSIDKSFWVGTGVGVNGSLPLPLTHTAAGTNVILNTNTTWTGNLPGTPGTYDGQSSANPRFAWTGYINIDKSAPRPPVLTLNTNNGTNPTVLCKDGCVTLTANPADAYLTNVEYHFYRPSGPEILQGPTDPPNARTLCNMTTDSNGSYVVTITDKSNGNMVSDPATIKVGVLDLKAPLVSGKQNYCLNESFNPVTVTGFNSSAIFLYYYTATAGSPIPFVPYFNTTTAHEDDYFVSQTLLGCESPRSPIKYTAAPKPNPPIVTTPIYYCENAPAVQLNANGQKPLNWYYQPSGGISSSIAPTPNTTKQDSFVYFVSQTVDGCEGDRSKIDVVVTFRPNGLIVPTRMEICQNDTLMLHYYGSAFPGSAYNWTFPSDATVSGDDSTPITIQLDSPGRRTIGLHVGVDGCYSQEYKQDIIVDAKPRASIVAADNLCQDQRTIISLSTYTPTIDSFFWDFEDGVVANASTDQGPYGVTWATPGKKTIALRIVDGLCSFIEIDTPTVHPRPDATFSVTGLGSGSLLRKEPFCSDDSVLLTPNTVTSFSTYSWTPNRFFDLYSNVPVVYAHLDYQDTTSIALTVTDQYGCMNTEKKIIHTQACCEVLFPTAFSPDGNGKNDYFHPVTYGRQDIRTMKIMNRWGQTVYESGANFPNQGWDGKINGKDAEMGSYYYFISYKCAGKTMDQKGEVVLIR